ncbi:MAG: hypothetical protein H8E18_17155 [FCB group bacterium]|nr:hypothetical protein [FCB group bacterium]
MKFLILAVCLTPLIAQYQFIDARYYQNLTVSTSTPLSLNDVTGEIHNWYKVTFVDFDITLESEDTACNFLFGCWNLMVGGGFQNPLSGKMQIVKDECSNFGIQVFECYNCNDCDVSIEMSLIIETPYDTDFYSSDWDGDGDINIVDIVLMVEFILENM